jgi:multicomponent Na+:H+ antiporter subunit D
VSGGALAALAVGLPLGGAALVALCRRRPNVREAVSLATGGALFLLVASLVPKVTAREPLSYTLVEMMPGGLSLRLDVEPLGMLFALIASGLWIVTTAYSIGYMRGHHEKHQTRFYVCFAAAISAAVGVAFAGNLVTLFVFYEVLTLSTYPLVTHHGTPEAVKAGRVYLGVLLTTSVVFLLLAITWTWSVAGTVEFRPGGILEGKADPGLVGVLLALFVFGTGKAAVMPFHRWLPAAMVAPTPVSALLHAVAVVKAGVFAILKVVVYVFGIDLLRATHAGTWLSYVAGATVVLASLVALTKDNLKARLAYSTISQLSYIVLGALLARPWSVLGGGLHILTHAFGKITLFFCAGAIMVAAHKTRVSEMAGIGRKMPFTLGAFLVGSLSVIGLPPFGGSWSKLLLALGAADAGQVVFVVVLMVSSLLNIAYLVPIVVRGFFAEPAGGHDAPGAEGHPAGAPGGSLHEAPLFCVVPLCFTAAGCLALFFFADDVYRLLRPIVPGGGLP